MPGAVMGFGDSRGILQLFDPQGQRRAELPEAIDEVEDESDVILHSIQYTHGWPERFGHRVPARRDKRPHSPPMNSEGNYATRTKRSELPAVCVTADADDGS